MSKQKCECADPGCPCCHGACDKRAPHIVYRIDMEDETGTAMCEGCMEDAMDSGLFTTRDGEEQDEPDHTESIAEGVIDSAVENWVNGNRSDVKACLSRQEPLRAAYLATRIADALGSPGTPGQAGEFLQWLRVVADE